MSRGRQHIQFEGYFSENVLGIFRVIRGFADLQALAAEIQGKLTPEIKAILEDAGAVLERETFQAYDRDKLLEEIYQKQGDSEKLTELADLDGERFDSESVNWELMKYLRWSRDRYQNWGGVG